MCCVCPREVTGAGPNIIPGLLSQATGQAGQRVHLATRAFSNSVATAMATRVPGREEQAHTVSIINKWFDVFNSRAPYDAVPERCAYGITPKTKAKQDAALDAMDACIREARKATRKQPLGRQALLPCQQGVLRSVASLRGLYGDLRHRHSELKFLMTSHLNQDSLENLFSQLRAMCGSNTSPNAVDARARLRILLMAPSPLEAVNRGRPVELEANSSYLSTGQQLETEPSSYVSSAIIEDLDVQVSESFCLLMHAIY